MPQKQKHNIRREAKPAESSGVTLGEEYTDAVSGIKGTAIAVYLYLSGCDQVCLEYVLNGEPKYFTVDATRLKELKPTVRRPGGPSRTAAPSSRSAGARY